MYLFTAGSNEFSLNFNPPHLHRVFLDIFIPPHTQKDQVLIECYIDQALKANSQCDVMIFGGGSLEDNGSRDV